MVTGTILGIRIISSFGVVITNFAFYTLGEVYVKFVYMELSEITFELV
jgi:hypothetical protein